MCQQLEADNKEIIASINCCVRAELFLNRHLIAAGWRFIDKVVVDLSGGMKRLNGGRQCNHFLAIRVLKPGEKQTVRRP